MARERSFIERLAASSAARPKSAIAAWVLAVVVAVALTSTLLGGVLTTDGDFTNDPEAKRAEDLLEASLRGPEPPTEFVVVRGAEGAADTEEMRTLVAELAADLRALGPDVVASVTTAFDDGGGEALVSPDRDSVLVQVVMAGEHEDAEDNVADVHAVTLEREVPDGFEVLQTGDATITEDFAATSEEDLVKGEAFGIPIALIVLLGVFAAVVAAMLPIALALGAIAVALAVVALVGQAFDFSFFVANMVTMMGLAVGIDYSLFIVSRYREERAHGRDVRAAIAATSQTASRAVFFSALTVVLALLGMLIIPTTIYRSLAAGAIFVVLASLAATLTLLPALLSLLGDRIEKGRVPFTRASATQTGHGIWARTARGVMRRPVLSVVLAGGLLLAAAVPLLDMRTGFSGVGTLPEDTAARQGFDVLAEEFAGGLVQPVDVVVDGPAGDPAVVAGVEELQRLLSEDPRFGPPTVEVDQAGSLTLVSAPLRLDPSSQAAYDAIRDIRDDAVPAAFGGLDGVDVLVGGETAFNVDFFSLTRTYTPIVFAFVLGLSFVLLMVVFRSIVVPLKAIVMNLLSVGAAYGIIVLVNQKGWFAGVLGFQQVEVIEAWLPLFLFSVLFGLSMDYHVFLLSRIKEHFDETGDNTESVAFGVQSTAKIITGAALIMVAVFAGFATGDLTMLQQMGFGLAVAVLLDATIVRMVLVPASMRLLGNANWYLPSWLEWLPRVHLERATPPEPAPAAERREVVGAGTR